MPGTALIGKLRAEQYWGHPAHGVCLHAIVRVEAIVCAENQYAVYQPGPELISRTMSIKSTGPVGLTSNAPLRDPGMESSRYLEQTPPRPRACVGLRHISAFSSGTLWLRPAACDRHLDTGFVSPRTRKHMQGMRITA